MKYKLPVLSIILICISLLFINLSCKNTSSNKSEFQEDSVRVFLKGFYTKYIISMSDSYTGEALQVAWDTIANKYFSFRLKKLLFDLYNQPIMESDPFINSNMLNKKMLDNLSIKKDSLKDKQFIVTYTVDEHTEKIRLILIKDGPNFKIDSLPDIPKSFIDEARSKKGN